MDYSSVITAGALTIMLVEGIKWLVRKIMKNDAFSFPTWFYMTVIPVLNAVMPFVLVLLGILVTDPILDMGVVEVVRYLLQIFIASLISFFGYNTAVKPLKEYGKLVG